MMDLAELRINRTPVSQNSKCESCVHYDGNAAAKGGACEVGQSPALCGNGSEPKYGYADLAELSPDEIDDLATPQLSGVQGAMNEHGDIEPMVPMKRVCLGDEDLIIAQRIHGVMLDATQKSIGYAQGQVNMYSGAEMAAQRIHEPHNLMVTVAKSLYDLHLSPREQRKFSVFDVLTFLKSRGMPVTDDDLIVCKSRFGPTRKIQVPTMAEAHEHLRAYNAANRAPGGAGSAPSLAPRAPRNRTPTEPLQITKSAPNVRKLGADPFVKRR